MRRGKKDCGVVCLIYTRPVYEGQLLLTKSEEDVVVVGGVKQVVLVVLVVFHVDVAALLLPVYHVHPLPMKGIELVI